jgi:hypothetical protein
MEIKTKDIIVYAAAAVGVYFIYNKFFKKVKPVSATATNTNNVKSSSVSAPPTSDGTQHKYPIGATLSSNQTGNVPTGQKVQLKEGDAIKGIPETVYILKGGEKHPVTGAWWIYNYGEDWSNIIQLSNTTIDLIPTGSTFTINGQ